jgi:hypothetical protein
MTDNPFFSIILPTFGRGRHIIPTIESVLRQTFGEFELIVVGDGCTDDTEAVVRSFPPERITWRNLVQNTGSQSFPNNEGIRSSHGPWVAYIGHDDIWARNHLECIAQTITSHDGLDFVVSGCVYYGPKGSDIYHVTGLFDILDAPFGHFFPPTSIAHRRDVTARIGNWQDPHLIKAPVDADFLLRAARAQLRLASTGRITAHKFAAGHRYLSYLRVSSDEQQQMLRALEEEPGIDSDEIISTAKKSAQYMSMRSVDYSVYPAGSAFEYNRQNKGISKSAIQPLHHRTVIEQSDESRALDWYGVELHGGRRYRWSGPHPRPKILIPYTGNRARVSIQVLAGPPSSDLHALTLFVEDQEIDYSVETGVEGVSWLISEIPLKASDYTVLALETPMFRPSEIGSSEDTRKLGIAVADIVLEPI